MEYAPVAPVKDQGIVSANQNTYRFADIPPRLVSTEGYDELFVTPMSHQAELMAEANELVGVTIDRTLQDPSPKRPLSEETRADLTTTMETLTDLNSRLRGRAPITPQEIQKTRRTPAEIIGKLSVTQRIRSGLNALGWRTATTQTRPFSGEAHFDGFEALMLVDNLKQGSTELRRQAHAEDVKAKQARHELTKLGHRDQARVWRDRADKMRLLHNQLASRLSPLAEPQTQTTTLFTNGAS